MRESRESAPTWPGAEAASRCLRVSGRACIVSAARVLASHSGPRPSRREAAAAGDGRFTGVQSDEMGKVDAARHTSGCSHELTHFSLVSFVARGVVKLVSAPVWWVHQRPTPPKITTNPVLQQPGFE